MTFIVIAAAKNCEGVAKENVYLIKATHYCVLVAESVSMADLVSGRVERGRVSVAGLDFGYF